MTQSACPGAETLGELIDGSLAGRDREAAIRHVVACPACYEVFIGARAASTEARAHEKQPPVVPRWVLAAAASVAALAAAGALVRRAPPPARSAQARAVPTLAAAPTPEPPVRAEPPAVPRAATVLRETTPPAEWEALGRFAWNVQDRHLGLTATGQASQRAVLAGVKQTDAEVAARGGPAAAKAAGLETPGPADAFELGQWLEAARLAASARNAAFFADVRTRAAFARLAALASSPQPPARRARERVQAALLRPPRTSRQWVDLADACQDMILSTPRATEAGLLAAATAFAPAASAQDSPRNHAAWWITTYGAVDAAEDEVVARVHRIFDRVAAVADKAVGRVPRLVVLRDTPTMAAALPDGTVLLSRAGVALAYKGASTETGDARLAFVLGHELRHLAGDDFWHAFTAAALETAAGDSPPASTTLRRDLKRSSSADRVREMHADWYGFLYAVMAGYPVDEAVAAGGTFLERWAAESATEPEAPDSHPRPADRAALLAVNLREVQDRLDLFHFGVRLLQLGRSEDALALLETFKEHFPSREVLGNIGVARLQLAVRALAACDARLPMRFRLPTRIDPEALVAPARMRGPASAACASLPMVRERMTGAIDDLQKAVEMDRGSAAGWTNLSSALILAGEYARAMDAAGKGLALGPDVALAGNAALAHYAYGVETRIAGLADAGQREIERLARENTDDAALAFNLGAVLAERGRTAGARDAWMRFLALEPDGSFAAFAREQLGIAAVPPPRPPRVNAPPIPLGEPSEAARKSLDHLAYRKLETGGLRGVVYRGAGLAVLEIDGSVELVEVELAPPRSWEAMRGDWGRPITRLARPGGETLVYAGVAVDVAGGQARRRIHFVP